MVGACTHCHQPVEEAGRGVIHTSGRYRCDIGSTWAELLTETPEDIDRQKYADAFGDGYRQAEDDLELKLDDAYEDGRHDLKCKILTLLETHPSLDEIRKVLDD